MKKILYLTFAIVFFIVCFYFFRPVKRADVSYEDMELTQIDTLPEVIDVGVIPIDTVIYRTVGLKNIGEHKLYVKHIETKCSCVKVKSKREPVAKNDTFWIYLEIRPNSTGYFSKKVSVYGNITRNPATFIVRGDVYLKRRDE